MEKNSVKVAHNIKIFSKDGSVYTERITINLTKDEIKGFNSYVMDKVFDKETDSNTSLFLKRISKGDNYTNKTTFKHIVEYFHLKDSKRIKMDKNVIFRVIIK